MAFKFNIKSDDFTTYGRMFDYAKLNPRFNENSLAIITNEQARQNYIYTYAMLNDVEAFNNEGFDEDYYSQIAAVDPSAAASYIGYKAFGDYDRETEEMWEGAREHFIQEYQKTQLSTAQKHQNVLDYYNDKTKFFLFKLMDEFFGSLDWIIQSGKNRPTNMGASEYNFTTIGDFFRDWRSNMDETNERLDDDRWYKFLYGGDKTINEETSELRQWAYYNTDLYSSLEDAFDGIQLGGKISVGDLLDFVHDGLMSAAKMSLNFIPIIGQALYWSTVATSSIEESRNIKDPLLLAIRMVGGFAIEYVSEQMFYDTFIRSGLFNPKKAFLTGKMNPIVYALSSIGIDMTTNAIEEMVAEVMNYGMDFTLREFYGKTQDAAIFDELPETFSEGFNQVAVAGLSGAFIGLLGVFGDIVRTQAVTSVDATGKPVRFGKAASYQFRSIQQMMGNLGNPFDNRNRVVEKLRKSGLSDAQIAVHKDYVAATEADNKMMSLYNAGMAQIETVLRKNGYTDVQIDANTKSVQEMFTYYKGLEYNFQQNIIPNRSRDTRKDDKESGRTLKRSADYFSNIESYEKAFKDRFGGKVTININLDSYTNADLSILAKRAGYDAIVVGDIGAIEGSKAEAPVITIKGENFKGTVVGDVLYIDSAQYNQVGSQSKLLRQIIINKIATNIVGNVGYEFGTAGAQADFYQVLAGIFKGDVGNGPIRFQQMVEKYGVEGARNKIIETFLNSPAAIRSLYVENNRMSKRVLRVINDTFETLAKEFKDTIKNVDGLTIVHYYQAQHLNNVALGITADIETFDKQLARDIRKIIKDTPLAQRADVIAQFAESNYNRILKESKDISIAFMRTLGFVEGIKVADDIHFHVKESVSQFLSTLGFTINHAKDGASYTSFSDLSDAEMAMVILSNTDLQYALTVEIPQFRNAFVLFLQDFIQMDGISDEHLKLARDTLKAYILTAFAEAPDSIKDSVKQSVLKVEKQLIRQGKITADGEVISAIESATGFMEGSENVGDLADAWQSWNIPHKVMASRALTQLKAFAPKLFAKMKTLGDVYNYLYSDKRAVTPFIRDMFLNNKVTYKDGVFSANLMDIFNLFGITENSLTGKSNTPLLLFISNLINDGNVFTQDDFLSNKTLTFKHADLTNHKVATAFLKSFGYALTKDIKGGVVSLKITEVRGFMNNKYAKENDKGGKNAGNDYVRNVIDEVGFGKPISIKTVFDTKAYVNGLVLTPAQRADVLRTLNSVNIMFENRREAGESHIKAKFNAETNTIIVYANESIYKDTHVFNELMHEMTHAILHAQKMGGLEFSYTYALLSQKNTKFSKLMQYMGMLDVKTAQQISRLNTKGIGKLLKKLGIAVDATTQSADFVTFVKALANLVIEYRTDNRFAGLFTKDADASNLGFANAVYLTSQAELLASDASNIDSLARTLMPELSGDSKIIAELRKVESLARKALNEGFDNRYTVFSQEIDSDGNALSVEQVEYYKDVHPELRDEDGRLKTLYHGSFAEDIRKFDISKARINGFFFTNDWDNARSYADMGNGSVYAVHLKMTNPYIVDAKGKSWYELQDNVERTYTYADLDSLLAQRQLTVEQISRLMSIIGDYDSLSDFTALIKEMINAHGISANTSGFGHQLFMSMTNEDLQTLNSEYYEYLKRNPAKVPNFNQMYETNIAGRKPANEAIVGRSVGGEFLIGEHDSTNVIVDRVIKKGVHDGVIFKNIVDYGGEGVISSDQWVPHDVFVVLDAGQINMVRNYNPYDMSVRRESFSQKIIRDQLKETQIVDKSGKPLEVYHGSPANFDKFDMGKTGTINTLQTGLIYFTNDKATANAFSYETKATESDLFVRRTGKKGEVRSFYLAVNNPLDLTKLNSSDKQSIAEYAAKVSGFTVDEILQNIATWEKHGTTQNIKSYIDADFLLENGYDGLISRMYSPNATIPYEGADINALEYAVVSENQVIYIDSGTLAKPVIKWTGGKTRILNEINKRLPSTFNDYYEPFVGGGAVLFNLNPATAVINDYNREITTMYEVFKDESKVVKLKEVLDMHEQNHSEEYFKKIRALDRDGGLRKLKDYEVAARFIYLNKAGFNGKYEVNSKGEFSGSFGHKPRVNTYTDDNFQNVVSFFKNTDVTIKNGDFTLAVKDAKAGDFVYLDPPYDSIRKDGRVTPYTERGFTRQDQIRVANVFKDLDKRGVNVMLSNHNTPFIQNLYKGYNIDVITTYRSLSSEVSARGVVEEVIVTNYDTETVKRESFSQKITFLFDEKSQLYGITARNAAGTRSRGIIVLHPRKTPGAVARIQGKIVRADNLHRSVSTYDVKTALRTLGIMEKYGVATFTIRSGIAGLDAKYIQGMVDGNYRALVDAIRNAKETRFESEKDLNKHLAKLQPLVDALNVATENIATFYKTWSDSRGDILKVRKTKALIERHEAIEKQVKVSEEKLTKRKQEAKALEETPAAKRGQATVKVQEALGTIDVLRKAREDGSITKHKGIALAIMETIISNYYQVDSKGKRLGHIYGMEFTEQSNEVIDDIMRYFDNDDSNFGDWESALEEIYSDYFGGADAETTEQRIAANEAMKTFLRYFRSNKPADSYEYGTFVKNLMNDAYGDITHYAKFMEKVHDMWRRLSWETTLLNRVQTAEDQVSKMISRNYKPSQQADIINSILQDVDRYFKRNPKDEKGRYTIDHDKDIWNPLVKMLLENGRIFDANGNLNLAGRMFETFVEKMVTDYGFDIDSIDDPTKFFKDQVKGEKRSILKEAKVKEKQRQAEIQEKENLYLAQQKELRETAAKIKIEEIKTDDTIVKNQRIGIVRFVEDYERITGKVLTAVEKDALVSLFDYTTGESISEFVGLTTDGKIQYMIMNTNVYDQWLENNESVVSQMSIEAWQELATAIMELSYHGFVPDIARINFMNLAQYFFNNKYRVSSRSANAKAIMKIGADLNAIMGVWVSSSGTILAKQKQIKSYLSSLVDIDINYVHVVRMAFVQHVMQSENITREEAVKRIEQESFSLTIGELQDIFRNVGEATNLTVSEFKELLRKSLEKDERYQEDVNGKKFPDHRQIDALLGEFEKALMDGVLPDGSKLSEEELKISYKAMDDLWRSAVEMRNFKAVEFMRALFNEKAQQLARGIDFKKDALLGKKGNTPEERRKNQLAGLNALGRQLHSFRFMAMLSNPSVYVKNRYLNATNSMVQRYIIDPLGGKIARKFYESWQAKGKVKPPQHANYYIKDRNGSYVNITTNDAGTLITDITRVDHHTKATPINQVTLERYEKMDKFQQEGLSGEVAYLQYFTTLNEGKKISKEARDFVKTHLIDNGFLKHIQERSSNVYFRSLSPEAFDKYLDRTNPFTGKSKVQQALYYAYNKLYDALEGQDFATMRKNIEHTVTVMVENLELYKGDITYETEIVDGKEIKHPVLGLQLAAEMDRISQVAFEKSLEIVFKSPNKIHDIIKKLGKSHPFASFLQQALIPFPRVATNIFSQIIKFSPLGFIDITKRMLAGRSANVANDQSFLTRLLGPAVAKTIPDYGSGGIPIDTAFFDRLGSDVMKASVGSAFFLLGSLLSALGLVGLRLEKDPVSDYRGYVMALDIMGETYHVDISSALPTAMSYPLLLGAAFTNVDKKFDFGSVFEQFVNLTFLGNILDSTRSYKMESIVPDMVEDYLVSFSPSILRSAWRFMFNQGQLQYASGGISWTWLQRVFERSVPYLAPRFSRLSKDPYRGAKADPYTGERAVTHGTDLKGIIFNLLNFTSPVAIQQYIRSDVQKISEQYGVKIATSYNTTLSFDGKEGNLTDTQRNLYNQERGRAYSHLVQKTMKTATWRKANDEERAKILKGLGTNASTMAKASMWLANNSKNYYNYTSDAAINKIMREYLKNPRFRKVGKLKEPGVNYYGQWL